MHAKIMKIVNEIDRNIIDISLVRPTLMMTEETIAAPKQLMKDGSRITRSQIKATLCLLSATLTGSSLNIFVRESLQHLQSYTCSVKLKSMK